jgi:hypothetical protein
MCPNQEYPKLIKKGLEDYNQEENKNETFESASCGRSINVVISNKGRTYMWGRGEYLKNKFDDFRSFS